MSLENQIDASCFPSDRIGLNVHKQTDDDAPLALIFVVVLVFVVAIVVGTGI